MKLILNKMIAMILISFYLTSSGFNPVSRGKILWLSNTKDGNYMMITYYHENEYDYIETTSSMDGEYTLLKDMLPGIPQGISVSGCGHHIVIAATINEDVYIDNITTPNNINCGYSNTVYIPIISNP